jgi:hypothetical protein
LVRYIDEDYDGQDATVNELPPTAYLTLLVDGRISHSFPLRGEVKLGRDKTNAVVTADQKVSRHHATLTPIDDTFILNDQGSANGTYINGVLIAQPTRLKNNDKISFGDTIFVFTTTQPSSDAVFSPVPSASVPLASPVAPRVSGPSISIAPLNNTSFPMWTIVGCMGLIIIALLFMVAVLLGIFVGQNQMGMIFLGMI